MWAMMSFPIPKPTTQPISGDSQPPRHRPSGNRNQQQPAAKKNRENHNQLSGLDVLWAMQKAADKKNTRTIRNKKREKSESETLASGGEREEHGGDYSNIRPLLIKEEWGAQLDELEKRLQELS